MYVCVSGLVRIWPHIQGGRQFCVAHQIECINNARHCLSLDNDQIVQHVPPFGFI